MKKRNDIILIAILLLVAAAGFFLFLSLRTGGDTVVVIIDGDETARYPLNNNCETVITTQYGDNKLVIEDGKAYISEADCPDGICVEHRMISYVGDTIVCLPHKLVIKIETDNSNSDNGKEIDAAI